MKFNNFLVLFLGACLIWSVSATADEEGEDDVQVEVEDDDDVKPEKVNKY